MTDDHYWFESEKFSNSIPRFFYLMYAPPILFIGYLLSLFIDRPTLAVVVLLIGQFIASVPIFFNFVIPTTIKRGDPEEVGNIKCVHYDT